ncbi:MAG: hypothetical protein MJY89_05865 [Bacteroidales bacterium]|nr:hypothetical protein [Bacteroidales bacterium]
MNRFAVLLLSFLSAVACAPKTPETVADGGDATIFPDYSGVTVPRIIAPLNFHIQGNSDESLAVLTSGEGQFVVKGPDIELSNPKWRSLVSDSDSISVDIYTKTGGKWFRHTPFRFYINDDPIEDHLCYRRIFPGYGAYRAMGIYQRDLTSFEESLIFGHEDAGGAQANATCMNCHAFSSCDPSTMHLHIRGKLGGTLVNGNVYALKNPDESGPNPTYVNWSPDGRFIAYSAQKVKQWFNSSNGDILEVADVISEILVYDVESNTIRKQPAIDSSKRVLMPVFAPGSERIYYCAATPRDSVDNIKYGLYSIAFDKASGLCYGDSRCEVSPEEGSVSFPRISYDGRFLIFSMGDHGYFHAWHKDSDLNILNLETGERRAMEEINSNDSESCHSWSLSGKWIVFGSRRADGLYTLPYIAHIDESGHCTKPFLVPQKDPGYYLVNMFSFNLPEFVNGKVELDKEKILRGLENPLEVN